MYEQIHLTERKLNALLEVISDGGASPEGDLPPKRYIDAIIDASDAAQLHDTKQSHRDGEEPPPI